MTREYRTIDGDMIDDIVWHEYPDADQSKAIALVYEANRGLADLGTVLPGGLVVILPDIAAPVAIRQTRIWG